MRRFLAVDAVYTRASIIFQLIELVTSDPDQVTLLVARPATAQWCSEKGIAISEDMTELDVAIRETPERPPTGIIRNFSLLNVRVTAVV